MSLPSRLNIGIIICSQRKPRVGPQIAAFVHKTLQDTPVKTNQASSQAPSLTLIDLSEWNLPMYDESAVPSLLKHHSEYDHAHTRAWSVEVQRYDAFVFVTPQYNWGYPASIKNAIDYLYHEWKEKPALIISYGGHGGGKAAAQLKQVLCGVRMRPTETMPELPFPGKEFQMRAASGEDMDLIRDDDALWVNEKKVISKGFGELLELLESGVSASM